MEHKEQSPGKRFKIAVNKEKPLQIPGVINAYCALLATQAGYRALYLSGGGVAMSSLGMPDLGITNLNDVLEDARRITDVTDLPLLVDIDTGWGSILNIARSVQQLSKAGVAAIHIEDQVSAKRCGHRSGKTIVPVQEMLDRIKAVVDARTDPDFVLMARTDAFQNEGLAAAIDRAHRYVEAGADMIFAEALTDLEQYHKFVQAVKVPVLANMTEFGKTPQFTLEQLRSVGVSMALYPLSAFRAMNKAAIAVYEQIRQDHQKELLASMQTRDELYKSLDYDKYEQLLDRGVIYE
ncbi:MAG: methylisocitrate lyase [Gammaproteobacteria bacterium]